MVYVQGGRRNSVTGPEEENHTSVTLPPLSHDDRATLRPWNFPLPSGDECTVPYGFRTFMIPNKQELRPQLIQQLVERLSGFDKSAREAHSEATHEQNKAENKYDTRAIEASYLAEGQARQAAEVAASIETLEGMLVRALGPTDPIAPGALVELESSGGLDWYFLAPCAGGAELISEGVPVLVITPQSPLGGAMSGLKTGGTFRLQFGRESVRYTVKSVH